MFDSGEIAHLISAGLKREQTPDEIAEEIVALLEDPRWARAMGHPARGKILRLLREHGELSPTRTVSELEGESLGTISYHFRHLAKLGLIEVCDTVPRRGAIEHVYRLTDSKGRH